MSYGEDTMFTIDGISKLMATGVPRELSGIQSQPLYGRVQWFLVL